MGTPEKKGKKVIFISDGKIDGVIDDVLACGADGFFAESYTDLESLSQRYGQEKVIVGNIDGRILEEGTEEDIRKEVERCTRLGKDCPGYFYCVSNHLTHTIPTEKNLLLLLRLRRIRKTMKYPSSLRDAKVLGDRKLFLGFHRPVG